MKPQSRLPSGTLKKTLCTQKNFPLQGITKQIISCAIDVNSIYGPGLLERICEVALAHVFSMRKQCYERQKAICLSYKGKDIGNHRIDYLVEDEVIVELKALETMHRIYEA
jgi:GxxExxY protein